MDSLKKFIGIIFAVLFITTAVPALVLFNFDHSAFTAKTYQKAFAKDDFYGKLPVVMAEAITTASTDQSQFPIVMRGMSQQAWEAFFRTLLPQETLKAMGDDILNSTFNYLNLQTDSVQLSLAPLKASMVSDLGVQAVFALLNTQADCTFDQILQMTFNLLANGEMQFCKPPDMLYPTLAPAIEGQMQIVTQSIPDQVTLINAPLENDPRVKLHTARLLMRFSPIFPFMFLLMLTVLMVNSLKSWLNWWGIPIIIVGASASILSLSGVPIFGVVFQRILMARMPDYLPRILLDHASDLASAMLQAIFNPILWQGLIITLIGLVMAGGSYFIKGNKKMG